MAAYYNEIEPYAAAWLRNLISRGLIADGEVDERSIVDVRASELRGFAQCHFFGGIGVWSHALRLAGWPDDRPVWTGSCPCQPFSAAGKGKGFDDERHLWPVFHRLISECRPPVVFGEQVASKDGLAWLDTVHADLQASGYACGAVDWCAAGVGAPHIRQRLWFVGERLEHAARDGRDERRPQSSRWSLASGCGDGGLADAEGGGSGPGLRDCGSGEQRGHIAADRIGTGGLGHHHQGLEGQRSGHQAEGGWIGAVRPVAEAGELGGMADAMRGGAGNDTGKGLGSEAEAYGEDWGVPGQRLRARVEGSLRGVADADGRDASAEGLQRGGQQRQQPEDGGTLHHSRPGPTNGHWRAADWLHCRDGKWRPVEPGTFPLAHGAPARVGRLRAYGNAIVGQVAAEVIGAYMHARP